MKVFNKNCINGNLYQRYPLFKIFNT